MIIEYLDHLGKVLQDLAFRLKGLGVRILAFGLGVLVLGFRLGMSSAASSVLKSPK